MLGQFGHSRAMSVNVGEIERRLRSVEQRLERVGGRASSSALQTADHVGETVAAALSSIAERFRGGANSERRSDEVRQRGREAWQPCITPPFQGGRASPACHPRSGCRCGNSCGPGARPPLTMTFCSKANLIVSGLMGITWDNTQRGNSNE